MVICFQNTIRGDDMVKCSRHSKKAVVVTGNAKGFPFIFLVLSLFFLVMLRSLLKYGLPSQKQGWTVPCILLLVLFNALILSFVVHGLLPKTYLVSKKGIRYRLWFLHRQGTRVENVTAIRSFAQAGKAGRLTAYFTFKEVRSPFFGFFNNSELIIESGADVMWINSTFISRKKIFRIGAALATRWDLSHIEVEDHLDIIKARPSFLTDTHL
jgi:hypothetical protein